MATALAAAPCGAAQSAPAGASDSVVITRGSGPAVVLLAGLLGGTARLTPLADSLAHDGFGVVVIDPYRLGMHSPDVSFHGLAHQVDSVLAAGGVTSAVVVAHAHATSIALCLAAISPARVQQLVLLDGGILPSPRSPGIAQALRVASFIARLPFGHAIIRSRMTAGIRANSADARWLTEPVAHAYVDPILARLPDVARLARRLSAAREPEPADSVVARVRTQVTVLLGGAPHPNAAEPEELAPLEGRPGVHIRRLPGVGHFVYEEVPALVVSEIEAAHVRGASSLH